MRAVKDVMLFNLIHDYFKVYLPKQKRLSHNTIRSYQGALELLLDFISAKRNIRLSEVTFDMIDPKTIIAFLDWLEEERGCGASTQNQRLQCIRSFCTFAADVEPTAVIHKDAILKVKPIPVPESGIVEYMSETAIKAVLSQPDTTTQKGIRDLFLMVLLYDTGARIQEVLNIRLRDLQFRGAPMITLLGKGQKIRNVSMMGTTVEHFKRYAGIFHTEENSCSEQFLFYVSRNNEKKRMTEDNVRRFIRTYGAAAHKVCPEVPDNVHPHLFRHSRAMHLYQHGMPLALISQWLGHSDVETTLIYAHADTEMKRKAIEAATPENSLLRGHLDLERYTVSDEEMIKRLYGLR